MSTNPIAFTSQDFNSILADINADPNLVDKPEWVKRILAGIGDMVSLRTDYAANEAFLRTALTATAVDDHLAMIDYFRPAATTSTGTLRFHLGGTTTFPKTVLKTDLAALSDSSISVSSLRFEARADFVMPSTTQIFTAAFATDLITVAASYETGNKVWVSTSGTLPGGLSASTDYWTIKVSATTMRLATTEANAYAGTYIDITTNGTGTQTVKKLSFDTTAYQQTGVTTPQSLGTSDGSTQWQEFTFPSTLVLSDSIEITVNGSPWTNLTPTGDSFVDFTSADLVYRTLYKTDGTAFIRFGDGTYGAIPGAFPIEATWAVGGGTISNITVVSPQRIHTYSGSDPDVTGVSQITTFDGGSDRQSLSLAKQLGPVLVKARNRFVTPEDGEALTLAFGGVTQVKVNRNFYGTLSAQVLIVPTGGGDPSNSLRTNLQDYLINKSVLKSMDIRVYGSSGSSPAVYVVVNVTGQAKILDGYTFAAVQPFLVLASRLVTTEVGRELQDKYQSEGLQSGIAFINAKWGSSFTVSNDGIQIRKLLDFFTPAVFGRSLQLSDFDGIIKGAVNGVDYITISVPSFPVSVTSQYITQDGTMSWSAI